MFKNFNEKPWTQKELKILYESRLLGMPYSSISDQVNRSENACRKKWRRTKWKDTSFYNSEAEKERKDNVNSMKEKYVDYSVEKNLDRYRMRSEIIADRLSQVLEKMPAADLQKWSPSKKKSRSSEDVGLLFSDLHIGHEHRAFETGGISEYSMDIFSQRLNNLKVAVSDIYELHSGLYDLPNLHIFSLGDIVDGMNQAGAWSPVYISATIYDQVMMGLQEISEFIYYLLTIFPKIHFYGIRGNHGRVAVSGAEKDYNNWDNIIYEMLKLKFEDNPRIEFHIPKTWWMMKEIRSHKYLMVHGDDVRGKSIPLKGFVDFELKMSSIIKDIPNYTLAGHFHNASEVSTSNGRILINGSFVGSDVYSLKNIHADNPPIQKIFGMHDEHGITWTYNINLDIPRRKLGKTK